MTDNVKAGSEILDATLAKADIRDLSGVPDSTKLNVLVSLLVALDSGMKILKDHLIDGKPEPFEGTVQGVIRQQLTVIEMARKSRLLP